MGSSKLTITIEGMDYHAGAGPFWHSVQSFLCHILGKGRLTRIHRQDGGANYRIAGTYYLYYVPSTGKAVNVTLILN